MTSSRRAADALERALRDPATAGDDRTRHLVRVAGAVVSAGRSSPAGLRPDDDFREVLHRRLLTEAATLSAERAARGTSASGGSRRRGSGPRVLLIGRGHRVATTLATVLAGGVATAVASTAALPGDVLYPVKRGVEEVRLAVSLTDAARASTELALARERVEEVELLATASGAEPGRLDGATTGGATDALRTFEEHATSGLRGLLHEYAASGDARRLAELETFLREVLPRLEHLRDLLPAPLQAVVDGLVTRLVDIAREVAVTAAACGAGCSGLGIGQAAALAEELVSPATEPLLPTPALTGAPSTPTPDPAAVPAAPGGTAPPPPGGAPGTVPAPVAGGLVLGGGSILVAPAPGVAATIGVPSVRLGPGGATVGVPLPAVTVGDTSVRLPSVGVVVPGTPPTAPPTPPSAQHPCLELVVLVCVTP